MTCIWFAPDFSAGSKFIGYIVLIAAVFSGALYVVYLKKHSSYYSSLEVTYIMTIGGCLFFNVLSLTAENGLRGYQLLFAGGSETAALLFLGVGCSCIAYAISAHAISKLKTVVVSNIQTNSATVVGVIAGITLGGDTWGWYTIIGLIMTITGICLCSLSGEKS